MNLKTDCLGHVPLPPQTMQDIYESIHTYSVDTLRLRLKSVCHSHERMRAEMEGWAVLHEQDMEKIRGLSQTQIKTA